MFGGDLADLVLFVLCFWAATACSVCMQVMELIKSKHCNPILVRLAWHDSGTYDKVNCPADRLTCSVPAQLGKTRLSAPCQPPLHSCAECVCSSWRQHSPAVWKGNVLAAH